MIINIYGEFRIFLQVGKIYIYALTSVHLHAYIIYWQTYLLIILYLHVNNFNSFYIFKLSLYFLQIHFLQFKNKIGSYAAIA